jgi:cell division septal protein FtsQ
MSIEDEIRREVQTPSGDRTFGEAANRWVTWQIVMSVIGLAIFLFFLLFFFLPVWNSFPRPF